MNTPFHIAPTQIAFDVVVGRWYACGGAVARGLMASVCVSDAHANHLLQDLRHHADHQMDHCGPHLIAIIPTPSNHGTKPLTVVLLFTIQKQKQNKNHE